MKPSEIFFTSLPPPFDSVIFLLIFTSEKSQVKWPKIHQVIFCVIKHTHTLHKLHYGYNFWNFFDTMMIFEIKSGTFSKRGSGLILNFWSSSQLKLATNYEFVSKHHIFWTYTNKNPRFFCLFWFLELVAHCVCYYLYDALKFGRMYL